MSEEQDESLRALDKIRRILKGYSEGSEKDEGGYFED